VGVQTSGCSEKLIESPSLKIFTTQTGDAPGDLFKFAATSNFKVSPD